jgi:peptide maturation system acyl carrier-related protein
MFEKFEPDDVLERIEHIIEDRLGISIRNISKEYKTENFLGEKIRMEARDLLYLFFEVEKGFKISIPKESILKEEFSTLDGIAQVVRKHLTHKAAV